MWLVDRLGRVLSWSIGLVLLGCAQASLPPHGTPGVSATAASSGTAPLSPPAPRAKGSVSGSKAVARLPAFASIHMMNATQGWGITADAIFRTMDGGRTWAKTLPPPGHRPTASLAAGFFGTADAWVAAAATSGVTVYRTTDGGQAWRHTSVQIANPQASPTASPPQTESPQHVTFLDPSHGWIWVSPGPAMGGEAGTLIATTDGGAHWTAVSVAKVREGSLPAVPYLGIKSGFSFTSATDGWMTVRATMRAAAAVYVTRDGGRTWRRKAWPPSLAPAHIVGLSPLSAATGGGPLGFAVLEGNGGPLSLSVLPLPRHQATWPVGQALTAHALGFFVSFADATHGFATDGRRMFVTVDGGATWKAFVPNRSLDAVTQLDFVSRTLGFALLSQPDGSELWTTADGGHTWRAVA